MIEIHGLHKAFGAKHVLNGVDITIADGQTMCIIGRSGCGKSVMLKHIVGLLTPDAGSVRHAAKNRLCVPRRGTV
jgi:phospholipid/cholesterol/gamma-HCH transport system ATP-binding protein